MPSPTYLGIEATTIHDVTLVNPKKKRAPKCDQLDRPDIKEQIIYLYGTDNWKLDDVVDKVNEEFGLQATKYQYRDRLIKWGCRQRLNKAQYEQVHKEVFTRQALGKRSKVLLDEDKELSEKKFKLWQSRNITWSDKLFLKVRGTMIRQQTQVIPGASAAYSHSCLVRSPSPRSERHVYPIIKRHIDIDSLNTPLGELHKCFKKMSLSSTGSSALVSYTPGHLPLPGVIVYMISNNLYEYDPRYGHIDSLLDDVNKRKLRRYLRKVISMESASMQVTREALITFFYLRKDDEMLGLVLRDENQSAALLYFALFQYEQYNFVPRPGGRDAKDILSDISDAKIYPKQLWEICSLFSACKRYPEYFDMFRQYLDQSTLPIADIDNHTISDFLFSRLGNDDSEIQCSVESLPLYSSNPSQLKWLLKCGFSRGKFAILFDAIIRDRQNIAEILCNNLGLTFSFGELDHSMFEEDTGAVYAWDLVEKAVFVDILANTAIELRRAKTSYDWNTRDTEMALLIHMACLQPSSTKYILDIMVSEYSLSMEEAVYNAFNLIPGFSIHDSLRPCFSETNYDKPAFLEILLQFGVDPNKTKFWKRTLWGDVWAARDDQDERIKILSMLLDYGAKIDDDLDFNLEKDDYRLNNFDPAVAEHFRLWEVKSPIELSLLFQYSTTFCFLLKRSADIERLFHRLTERSYSGVHPNLIRCLKERDVEKIKDLWYTRIQTPEEKIISEIEDGNLHALRHLRSDDNDTLRLMSAVVAICDYVSRTAEDTLHHETGYKILESLVEEGFDFSSKPEFWNDKEKRDVYLGSFGWRISSLFEGTRHIELFMKLDSENKAIVQDLKAPRYHPLQEQGVNLLYRAHLECLKFLINMGFCIDESYIWNDKVCTALFGAIESGNIDKLAYILSEGANIDAPCGKSSSAIECAISWGRIDSVALILEVVPGCYETALKAVEDPEYRHEHVTEYVLNWKHRSGSMDTGGIIGEVGDLTEV